MAVGFRSGASSGGWADSTSCAIPVPTGAASGDIAVAAVERWDGGTGLPAITPPAGFSQTGTAIILGAYELTIWWKRLTGADTGNYTFSWTGSRWNGGCAILVTGGLASGDPIEATNSNTGTSQSVGSTSVTVVDTDPFLAWFIALDGGVIAAHPTGFTNATSTSGAVFADYRIPAASGTHSASGASLNAAEDWQVALLSVKSAAAGGGGTTVSPTGIASGGAFGTAAISTGPVTVSPTGIASGGAIGSPVVSSGFIIQPTSIASAGAFGSPTVTTGPVTVSPTGIASSEFLGAASVSPGPVTISPSSIASGEAFGTASVSIGAQMISPSGIASSEALGLPTVTPGTVTVFPSGVASLEQFGTAGVTVAERTWKLIHPSTTENWPWRGNRVLPLKREKTIFGDDTTLYTTDIEGYAPAAQGDDYRAIPAGTKYVWHGGRTNTTTDPVIKALWESHGFTVVEV